MDPPIPPTRAAARVNVGWTALHSGVNICVCVPVDGVVSDLQDAIARQEPEWRIQGLHLHSVHEWILIASEMPLTPGSTQMQPLRLLSDVFTRAGLAWPPSRDVQVVMDRRPQRINHGRFLSAALTATTVKRLLPTEDAAPMDAIPDDEDELMHNEGDLVFSHYAADGLVPLAHKVRSHKRILVRPCYETVFNAMLPLIDESLTFQTDLNILVTGNPGVGKSRFYIYCIVRMVQSGMLVSRNAKLIVNFGRQYRKYSFDQDAFTPIYDKKEIFELMEDPRVVRLIEACSSQPTGWSGVSILFASPGAEMIRDFTKIPSQTFILPVWTLDELWACNSLLSYRDRLDDATVIDRFMRYGGCPRSIFVSSENHCEANLITAINTFDALQIIRLVTSGGGVRESNYSHCVLQMAPDCESFKEKYHLDFLSQHIGERVMAKADDDSLAALSEFAVANAFDDSGMTAVLQGRIFELFGHRFFRSLRDVTLVFEPLWAEGSHLALRLSETMQYVPFDSLNVIISTDLQYYRPRALNFGAVDAFILDHRSKICYALQMTINKKHGIKVAPMKKFIKFMGELNFRVVMVFVVPESMVSTYEIQSLLTAKGTVHNRPGKDLKSLPQYVMGFEGFYPRQVDGQPPPESCIV